MQQSDGSQQTVTGTGPANHRTYTFGVTGNDVYVYAYFGYQHFEMDLTDNGTTQTSCSNGQALDRFDGLTAGSTARVVIYPVNGC